ncbi:hypothetical protein C7H83_06190 [Tetragenococcus halophilus]|uniref:Uncharacterized protein n=1 Tax=Tetragenococcus halophilus TaxID=51669 RepID=A0A3G5FID8_TETHA|nr:acyltransferase family protein [Tetragenococcus halophilus]MDN6580974.1 hypothetical protein [Tetragenococcus koreensis]AYW50080.1 hypothetical protein C7H83_06190 [Tetragenococcus halophilus]MCO7026772.1 hypothetical protein [Tetragenococcus halophilus]MCO8290762.1 hypothetical protein [Tetragenococcus halophilus]GBD64160.1 hypothetical protein TEHD23766T_1587 [Tetragenococcus halophilus subsp. flandriensis]
MRENYPLLDIARFLAAISIILIHCGRLVENDFLHFFLKNTFARLAVPLFIISSSYFYRKKAMVDTMYPKKYFSRQWKRYVIWSIFYLPYGWYYITSLDLSIVLYPIAFVIGLCYLGTCYHLWYFPALLFTLSVVSFLKKHICYCLLVIMSFLLFFIGASETYSAYLHGKISEFYTLFHSITLTNRNGLLYVLIFVVLGFIIADFEKILFLERYLLTKLASAFILLIIEWYLVFQNQGDDKNFYFGLLAVAFFLFCILIKSEKMITKDYVILRKYSQYLFFLHPLILESIKFFSYYGINKEIDGLPLFFMTLFVTLSVSWIVLHKDKLLNTFTIIVLKNS